MPDIELTVLGGLPVTIEYNVERTRTGDYLENWEIVAVAGKAKKNVDFIYNRIKATRGEENRILDAIMNRI